MRESFFFCIFFSTTRTSLADDCAHAGESGASSEFECAWTTWKQAAELQQGAIESDDAPEATFGSKRPRCTPSSYDGCRRKCQRSGSNGRRQWSVNRGWSKSCLQLGQQCDCQQPKQLKVRQGQVEFVSQEAYPDIPHFVSILQRQQPTQLTTVHATCSS